MKEFNCGDVVPGCNSRFKAFEERDILAQVAAHAQQYHGMQEISPSLVELVRSKIRLAA